MSPSDCVCLQSSPSGTIFWSHKLDVWLQEIQRCGNWSVTTDLQASSQVRVRANWEGCCTSNEGRAQSRRDSFTCGRGVKVIVQGLPHFLARSEFP
ncbi:hypothetical protein WJX79_000465 [Trebouxia sp. C0005]